MRDTSANSRDLVVSSSCHSTRNRTVSIIAPTTRKMQCKMSSNVKGLDAGWNASFSKLSAWATAVNSVHPDS
eukprot:1603283-Amphidinium_carterae.1